MTSTLAPTMEPATAGSFLDQQRLEHLEGVIERGLVTFAEVGQALLEIRDKRLYRLSNGGEFATFEDYCRERWGMSRRRANQLVEAYEVGTMVPIENERQARELTPLKDDELEVVEAWREAQAEAQERGVKVTAQVVRNAVRKRVARIEREQASEVECDAVYTAGSVEVRLGDLRTTLEDLTGTVDAIITDPPYPGEFIAEFDALGELAARLLKPHGVLVAMVGQTHLPDYITRLARHVKYRWCAAYLTDGPATRIHGRKVGTKWKPVLIFGGDEFLTQDVFESRGDDKRFHHWGQSESGMADIVERLTKPDQLVVDPFLGGGTTAVVCRDLGRRFIGCDIDPAAVNAARGRLGSTSDSA